jgi:hypothetical protein
MFCITLALVLATGLAVAAVPGASVQAAEEDRDNFEVIVEEDSHPYDYTYICTLVGGWITHDITLIDYQTDPPNPDLRSLNGTLIIKIENTVSHWSGFDTYGQLAVDWVELYRDDVLLDRVDIGDPVSEAGHNLFEWGPIEPANSGGYYGGFGPPGEGTGENCRVAHHPSGVEDFASLTLEAGEVIANKLVIRVLDGMSGTPPGNGEPGGCFIATAAYGTESAEEIDVLRAFRDEVLLESTVGSQLVEWYYQTSPPVADFIAENDVLRTLVRELVVDPIASLVEVTKSLWRD